MLLGRAHLASWQRPLRMGGINGRLPPLWTHHRH